MNASQMKVTPQDIQLAAMLADQLGIRKPNGERLDAAETAMLARQLEYIKARTYDVKYAATKARSFIPVSTEVPNGAETITYRQWDSFGVAKVVANAADDLPLVDVMAREFTHKVKSLGAAYQFSIQDLRAAAMTGTPLDAKRAQVARRVIDLGVDEVAAFGLPEAGIHGFLNHPNVPVVAPTTGNWGAATAVQILADMHKLANAIPVATKQVHQPDTLLLDTASFTRVASKPVSDLTPMTTVLAAFLATSPFIRNVDQWTKLDTANAAGSGPRAVAYLRDPEVLELEIPQDFEQFPPQARNLAFVVNCHSRVGGTVIRYPLAMAYMDGI